VKFTGIFLLDSTIVIVSEDNEMSGDFFLVGVTHDQRERRASEISNRATSNDPVRLPSSTNPALPITQVSIILR